MGELVQSRFGSYSAVGVVKFIAFSTLLSLLVAGCGDNNDAPDASISASSGSFSTTVRQDGTTELPFSEAIIVEVEFEEEVYGLQGRNSLRVETDPGNYRIEEGEPSDRFTYSFALIRNNPGEVEVSVYSDLDGGPVRFTLDIGDQD